MIKSMVEVLVGYTHSIKDIMEFLNNYFARITTHNMFATMFMGIIDKKSGVLEFCSAGHTPPIMFKNGVVFTSILNGNIPIGTFEGFEYKTEQIELSNIGGMLLYSDGITDVQNDSNEQLGEDRVISIVAQCLLRNEDVIETLKTTLQEFMGKQGLYDDTTLLLADRLNQDRKSKGTFLPVQVRNMFT
jgi:sigma-B regulation protein RsbU (phosphoserine phosphatase)